MVNRLHAIDMHYNIICSKRLKTLKCNHRQEHSRKLVQTNFHESLVLASQITL